LPANRGDEFVDALAVEMEALRIGDPADPETQLGPLVAQRQQQRVREYIAEGQREGARLVIGGTDLPDGIEGG
jgi:acyl-CoA reductase-like NAD-dependent aldehyde dehydrogenase